MREKGRSLLPVQHLSVCEYLDPNDVFNFLNRCPFLKSIRIVTEFPDSYLQSIFSLPLLVYYTITYLDLMMFQYFNEKIIIYLFKNLSEVRRLKLRCFPRNCPPLVDPSFWERSLSIYLVRLKRLYLDAFTTIYIQLINPDWNFLLNEEEICQKISQSTYWSSHGWKPTYFIDKSTYNAGYYSVRFAYD